MGFGIVGACFRVSECYKVPLVQITQLSRPRTLIMLSADSNAAAASSNSLEKNHRALILVVERNPAVQRLERYFLEQAGFSVEFATDGATALRRQSDGSADVCRSRGSAGINRASGVLSAGSARDESGSHAGVEVRVSLLGDQEIR